MNAAGKNRATPSRTQAKPGRSAKASGLAGMTARQLRELLLATPTISDRAWAPQRGFSRNEGEPRTDFIKRVLR
jgi:hypothetical protein